MMGRQDRDQRQLFYEFSLDEMIPTDHLLRRINGFATAVLADLHDQLKAFYSDIGRPSVDPELMIRMLLVGYCYGIRHERRLCQEVPLHLAYRWFCKLDLDHKVPHHSTFSVNRLGRFRESEILRHIFERVVTACMAAGLVKGEGFAVDASVMEANASRYHGKAPDEQGHQPETLESIVHYVSARQTHETQRKKRFAFDGLGVLDVVRRRAETPAVSLSHRPTARESDTWSDSKRANLQETERVTSGEPNC
jgi:transposase